MSVKKILHLGNPTLYKKSNQVDPKEFPQLQSAITDLADTFNNFKKIHKRGRAIAAPQIGILKRIIYLHITTPILLINPVLENKSREMMILWDDCMSFPDLLVKVKRHKSCRIRFRDREWKEQVWELKDDLSELLQHEYDHLDGILAVARAVDERSFMLRTEKKFKKK